MGSSLGGLSMAFYQVHLYPGELRLCGVAFWDSWLGLVWPAYPDDDRYLPFDVEGPTRLYLDSGGGTGDPCADLDGDG